MITYTVYGIIASPLFAKCSEAAEYVNKFYGNEDDGLHVIVDSEVPRDYIHRRDELINKSRSNFLRNVNTSEDESNKGAITTSTNSDNNDIRSCISSETEVYVMKHQNSVESILTGDMFLQEIMSMTNFRLVGADNNGKDVSANDVVDKYVTEAAASYRHFLRLRGNSYCWMKIKIGDCVIGDITFELYSRQLPRTCNNFRRLCQGYKIETINGSATLGYKNSTFFRILKEAWVMGGNLECKMINKTSSNNNNNNNNNNDNNNNDGAGGGIINNDSSRIRCCYGYSFPDESFAIRHDTPGILGMCNDGAHTNGSAFYITRSKMKWMDHTYVAFGRVIDGMNVVDAIHEVECYHNQTPKETVRIIDCGVLDVSV